MHTVHFTIRVSRAEILRWYRGEAHALLVDTEEGLRVQIPARSLRPFVTADGVSGRFRLRYDQNGRQISLRRAFS